MNKLKIFLLLLVVAHSSLSCNDILSNSKVSNKLSAFMPSGLATDIDWTQYEKEFSITGKFGLCKPTNLKQGIGGFDATSIEPLFIVETTREPYRFEFLQIDIGSANAEKTGTAYSDGYMYAHIFKFPIMSLLLKSLAKNEVFCFDKGDMQVLYMSEFDPTATSSILKGKVSPERVMMFTPQGLVASIASCTAYNIYDNVGNKRNSSANTYRDIIDTFGYVVGCNGAKAMGTFNRSNNPLKNGLLIGISALDDLAKTPAIDQTVQSYMNGYENDIMCSAKSGPRPFIMSQFGAQVIRPRPGPFFEIGTTPASWSNYKNDGSTSGNSVFLIWQRRDYRAFAYKCGN